MWKLAFGAGLSRKLDDLGAQGEWPSHPQLLGLAGRPVHRLRLERQARRQADRHVGDVPAIVAADSRDCASSIPENRWLARQGRFRLDAEMVRDNALKISGLLVGQDRRAERQAVSAARVLGLSEFSAPRMAERQRRRPLSPFALHALAAPIPASRHAGVRRARHAKNARPTGRGRTRRCNRWC